MKAIATEVATKPSSETSNESSARTVVSVILGGGVGSRLYPLTKGRSKPAVPVGGAYRLIDIPMSNCLNSGINKVYVLTQFNSRSLNRHILKTYNNGNGIGLYGGKIKMLPRPVDRVRTHAHAFKSFLYVCPGAQEEDS